LKEAATWYHSRKHARQRGKTEIEADESVAAHLWPQLAPRIRQEGGRARHAGLPGTAAHPAQESRWSPATFARPCQVDEVRPQGRCVLRRGSGRMMAHAIGEELLRGWLSQESGPGGMRAAPVVLRVFK
jgi:hypothetical protein